MDPWVVSKVGLLHKPFSVSCLRLSYNDYYLVLHHYDHSTWLKQTKWGKIYFSSWIQKVQPSWHGGCDRQEQLTVCGSGSREKGTLGLRCLLFIYLQPVGLYCPLQLILSGKYPQRHTQRCPQSPRSTWQRSTFTLCHILAFIHHNPSILNRPASRALSWRNSYSS